MEDNKNVIGKFTGEYSFLSNFYPSPLRFEGIHYPTSEHAYQASKTTMPIKRRRIAAAESPKKAKRMGQNISFLRPNWDHLKVHFMWRVLIKKFDSHHRLRQRLIDTGDAKLVEGNNWGDDFWGYDQDKDAGKNILGQLLMELRKKYKNGY